MHSLVSRVIVVGILAASLVAIGFAQGVPGRGSKGTTRPSSKLAIPARLNLTGFRTETFDLPANRPEQASITVRTSDGPIVLELRRWSIRTADFRVLEDRGDGELHPVAAPPVSTYRGVVAGVPGSTVAASIQDGKLWAVIERPDRADLVVEPMDPLALPGRHEIPHYVYDASQVRDDGRGCGNELFDMDPHGLHEVGGPRGDDGGVAGVEEYLVEIGCDTDFEFFQKNGNSVVNTVNDIENMLNGVDVVYSRDVGITYEISTIIVRSSSSDPYTATTIDGLLCEFRNKWNAAPESAIVRDVAQFFTGKNMGSTIGLAWLGVLCNQSGNDCGGGGNLAYSVVESRYTTTYNFRVSLSSHELGHNWNATHCTGSTCHIMCATNGGCGGISGSNLKFGPSEISQIVAYRNQMSCDVLLPPPLSLPFLETFPSSAIDSSKWIFVKGATSSLSSTAPPSPPRALNLDSSGNGEYQDDEIRSNFMLLAGITENIRLTYWTQHKNTEAGEQLLVEYTNLSNDWVLLNTITSDGVSQATFTQHQQILPNNAKHDKFRIRFRTAGDQTDDDWYVDDVSVEVIPPTPAPPNNLCTAAIAIGEGSTNFTTVGATSSGPDLPLSCSTGGSVQMQADVWYSLIAPCTGLLEVNTCTATFDTSIAVYGGPTCPGASAAPLACNDDFPTCGNKSKVFLEVTAGAPLLIRVGTRLTDVTGTGVLQVICTPSEPPCPGDVNDDGVVDGADLAGLLGSWGVCPGCAADFDDNGVVDGSDLATLLGGWGNCP